MKLNKGDVWILYRLVNDHLNSISQLASELKIGMDLDGDFIEYIGRLEKVEKKLSAEHNK